MMIELTQKYGGNAKANYWDASLDASMYSVTKVPSDESFGNGFY